MGYTEGQTIRIISGKYKCHNDSVGYFEVGDEKTHGVRVVKDFKKEGFIVGNASHTEIPFWITVPHDKIAA